MAVHRKRFRAEEGIVGEVLIPEMTDESAPMHSEIMAELRAIRAQMARNSHAAHASPQFCHTPAGSVRGPGDYPAGAGPCRTAGHRTVFASVYAP